MTDAANLRGAGDRIEGLLEEIRSMASPPAFERVEELVHILVDLYGEGLKRIVALLEPEAGAEANGTPPVNRQLLGDPLVASLLLLHGLHPVKVEDRVAQALEKVRPYLGSHAGGVELLGMDENGVVRLRLQGSCDGCPSSLVTVKLAIERAIEEAAPEVARVEVEGLTDGSPATFPTAGSAWPAGATSLPVLGAPPAGGPAGAPNLAARWESVEGLTSLPLGQTAAVEIAGVPILVCRVGESLFAYRNACTSCGSALTEGGLCGELLTCPACGQEYDVRMAGRSRQSRELHLDPLPLLAESEGVKIAVVGAP